ncbi:hypothetical protein ACHAWF_006409 [Thalassiosira exigua]
MRRACVSSRMGSLLLFIGSISATCGFQANFPSRVSRREETASLTQLQLSSLATTIDTREGAQRDIPSLYDWASNYGVQTAPCFELYSDDGLDIYAITNQNLPSDSPVVCVPNELIMTGAKAKEEFGAEASGAERALPLSDHTSFYLFLKVLKEYELGEQSPWYSWLNSLPRFFSNAASMTDFCFSCLPPYAGKQSQLEKSRLKRYELALDQISFLSEESKRNADLVKWAFNVVHTRYQEKPGGDYCIAPMADYFNHGGAETDVYITYDEMGNCYAYSTRDVSAGQPLRMSYGDATNPSKLLARYGFLDESSPGTYCKWIAEEPLPEMYGMGYPTDMLFYYDGSISNEVWDVLLLEVLDKLNNENKQAFYQAHMIGDEATKSNYHQQYFPQTLAVLQKHVNYIVGELEELRVWQATVKDTGRHPRLPLIMRHNDFVRNIFQLVKQNLASMGS